MGQIYSAGRAYQNATENPRGIVVIGIWLIFGPQIIPLLFGLFVTFSNLIAPGRSYSYRSGSTMTPISQGVLNDSLNLLLVIGLLSLYAFILWKVTVRYLRARREATPDQGHWSPEHDE
jgi:tellurite resistance protein TehA-like permease